MSRDKMFMMMRFHVMSFSLTDVGKKRIADAYLQAWDDGVYPIGDDAAHWHDGYENDFDVTETMMDDISKLIDNKWTSKQPIPSVYDLENHYKIRQGGTPWDRSKIISSLRYMFLHGWFDQPTWTAIMSNHPSEASGITGSYDRDRDVYFN